MPPKKKPIKKPAKKDNTPNKTSSKPETKGDVADVESDTEEPNLEIVSETLKERYEYKPIVNSEVIYVRPENRITTEVMTEFEFAEVVSIRAKQIENGSIPFTDVGDLTDPIAIAKKEIYDKRCPLDIVRDIVSEHIVEGKLRKISEKWHVNEMAIPYDT